jgi:clan AA aspartic protease (TIGR02281 family)
VRVLPPSSVIVKVSLIVLALVLPISANSGAQTAAPNELQQGIALYNQKSYKAALVHFCNALDNGNNATVLYYSALCYQQVGDSEHAQSCYKLVCELFPGSPEAAMAKRVVARSATSQPAQVNAITTGNHSERVRTETPAMPSSSASLIEVSHFLADYQLGDAEWRALPDQTKVPFERGTSSHCFVNGYVNGRPMRMMFDTGANNCVFYKGDLEAAGVKVDTRGPHMTMSGVAGTADAQIMMADVEIGKLKRHLPILVSSVSFGFSLIGESFFKDFRYNLDSSTGFIEFIKKPRAGMVASSHIYESTDVVKVPYTQASNNMVVNVKINGHETPMFFDTGANSITLPLMQAPVLGIRVDSDAVPVRSMGVGGTVNGVKVYVDRVELGPVVKTHVPVILNEAMSPPLLGQPFFSDRKFIIDTENHTINFVH